MTATLESTAAMRVEDALSLLALDRVGLALATRDRLGGHGLPAQLQRWMAAEYGAICAWCGEGQPSSTLQLGHLIPANEVTPGARGGRRGGYAPANIALSCEQCNETQGDAWADPHTMARPDLVPLSWPKLSWRNPTY